MIHRFQIVSYNRAEGEWVEAEVLQVTHIQSWWFYKLRDLNTGEIVQRVEPQSVREIPEYAEFQP